MGEATDLTTAAWKKSSHSGNSGGDCVEVAEGVGVAVVPVRDSKDPAGPVLMFSADAWAGFVAGVRAGDFPSG